MTDRNTDEKNYEKYSTIYKYSAGFSGLCFGLMIGLAIAIVVSFLTIGVNWGVWLTLIEAVVMLPLVIISSFIAVHFRNLMNKAEVAKLDAERPC